MSAPSPTATTFPKVYFSRTSSWPPRVVWDEEQAALLKADEWLTIPPAEPLAIPPYPKIMINVNLPPVVVYSVAQEEALGDAWVQYTPPDLTLVPDVPPVTLSPTSATVDAAGGPDSFDVTMGGEGASGTWEVSKDATADWLTIDSPTTPQTASGTVNYTVAANTGAARSANMYVNGKTFTVSQAAGV